MFIPESVTVYYNIGAFTTEMGAVKSDLFHSVYNLHSTLHLHTDI